MNDISMEQIKSLRSRTGSGIAICKEALVANNGDEEKAIDWLRQKGAASQAKRSDRDASEGVVAMLLEGNAGTLVSLKCETDFVAKNEDFWGLAIELCTLTIANPKDLANQALNGTKVSNLLIDKSAVIKENIQLGEVVTLESKSNTYVYGYAHGSIVPLPTVGTIGVLVRISKPDDNFGKKIAMHIAAMNPEVVSYEQIPSETIAREKEVASAKIDTSKPENVQNAMLEGMLKKALKDKVLLSQDYEDYESGKKYTIEQFAKEKDINILEFKRIEIIK